MKTYLKHKLKKTFSQTIKMNKDEKGVALILTLGILAFLLVLALGFASSAMLQKKAASNYASSTLARIIAESAAEKCLAGLAYYTQTTPGAAFDVIFSRDNNKHFDWLYRMRTVQNGIYYYDWPDNYNPNDPDAIHWQYVYNGQSGSDIRILGRYAYVVVPAGGKLNPGYCVSHSAVDSDGKPIYPDGTARDESTASETRVGKNVNEIRIRGLTTSTTYLTDSDIQKMSTTAAGCGGLLTDGDVWADTDTMVNSILGAGNETKKAYWNEWFAVNNSADPEKFWIDLNDDNIQDNNEWFHRFNIARTDWAGTETFMNNNILKVPSTWSTSPSDGDGIPWIKNWSENSGGWLDAATKAKQIAANIIDYCDSDNVPTTDLSGDTLTFMGLEKTPYINEIGIEVEATTTVNPAGGGNYNFIYNLMVYLGGERIDMYAGMPGGAANMVIVDGTLQYTYNLPSGGTTTATQSLSGVATTISAPGSTPGYSFSWGGNAIPPINPPPGPNNQAQLTNVRVQIKKVRLEWPAGTVVDFAQPDLNGGWSTSVNFSSVTGGSNTQHAYYSYQIDDPRHNLHDEDWDQATGQIAADYSAVGTANAVNSGKVTCTTSGDAEAGSSPTNLSTAFIRNAPMQSPWELGLIHRAAKWETLNLKKYNSTQGVKASAGGGAYADGDANILDQIKMHSNHSIYGKVNIRAPQNLDIVKALLHGIYVGANPSDWTGGSELDADQITKLANAIFGSSQRPFITRAQVAKVTALTDASIVSTQNTDAKKEEIIGKFINLCKTEVADEFVILVLAQAIKDIGGGVTIYKDINFDGDTNDTNLQGTTGDPGYYLSSSGAPNLNEQITNCQYGVYDLGADEILAEQKILVRFKYDPSRPDGSKWIVKRFEYLED